jgi:hypothetical protein
MDSPNTKAQLSHVLLFCLHPISLGHTSLRNLPHKTAAPFLSFFALAGRICLRTFHVQVAVSPLWPHNYVFPDWPTCWSTSLKDPPLPVNSHLCNRFLPDVWISAWLYCSIFPLLLALGGIKMIFPSCFQDLPIWNPQSGRQDVFFCGE